MTPTDLNFSIPARYYQESSTLQKVLFVVGTILFGVMIFHLAALLVTGGPLSGPVSLRKPATFAETGWLLCWSVAWLLPQLKMRSWEKGEQRLLLVPLADTQPASNLLKNRPGLEVT